MSEEGAHVSGTSGDAPGPAADEGVLARRVRDGDRGAFEQLARRYPRPVHAVVASYLVEPADVEDAAHETFLRVLERMHTFDPERRFAPWLYQIARNVARNRRKWLRSRERESGTDMDVPAREPGPYRNVERAEVRRLVREAMDRLPEQRCDAFRLFDVEGYSAEEIARLMGITAGTVRSHVHHARRRLRAELGPLLEEEENR